MGQSIVNFRIDEDLKNQMDEVCKDMGITLTTAMTLFIKKVVKEKRIPFEVSSDKISSEEKIDNLEKEIDEIKAYLKSIKRKET